ncbi:MAG TPA: 50S ribosomal protein L11 methyltransferase, partial [Solirubrobacteraceae bacterium]
EESLNDDEIVEYAVYGAPGELPSLPDLQAAAGDALVEISTSETADDWQERWRQFHRPLLLEAPPFERAAVAVPGLYVRPPWEVSMESSATLQEIVIDPGQAFGTGAHATTRLCLELLLEIAAAAPTRGPLIDVGAGSGVLAIAAARLGFAPVLALDHEIESVEAARANALVNDVDVAAERFDLRTEQLPAAMLSRGVVLANLLRPLLLELSQSLPGAPRQLVASGLLLEQADEVADAFATRWGMHERRRLQRGEWAALLLGAD